MIRIPSLRLLAGRVMLVLSMSLAVLPACGPLPGPGGVSSASGVMATVSTVVELVGVLVPFLRPLLERRVPDGEAKQAVMVSLQVFEATARAFQRGMATYDVRGADRCRAYALSGALTEAGRALVQDLGRAGVGWGPDLDALMNSLGRLLDRLGGACEALDGGLMMARGRAGVAIREHFASVEDEARVRRVTLIPLPSLRSSE